MNLGSLALLASLFGASGPAPASKAVIAVHELVVLGALEIHDPKLDAVFRQELIDYGINYADSERTRKFLASEPTGSCRIDYQCHGRLAAAVGASATLVVTAAPYIRQPVVTARLVAINGETLKSSKRQFNNPHPGTMVPVSTLREQIRGALDELSLGTFVAPTVLPKPPPETVKPAVVVPTPPVVTPQPRSPLVVAPSETTPPAAGKVAPEGTWIAFGAGGLCLVGGGIFAALANGNASALHGRLDGQGRFSSTDSKAEGLVSAINGETLASELLFAGAVVGAGVGALIWVVAPARSVQVSAAPDPHGARVLVSGSF